MSKENDKQLNHLAIICDGNRRWAKRRGLPSLAGHKKGFDAAPKLAKAVRKQGIHTLTMWVFSTENWNRDKVEIDYLMKMFEKFSDENLKTAHKEKVKIVHIGRKDRIPETLLAKLAKVEEETKHYTENILNIALDYGGHDDVLRGIQDALQDVKDGKITIDELTETVGMYKDKYPYYKFKEYLDMGDQPHPYPDLIVRTSGEQRLSGFMSWQSCYAEFIFPEWDFPDFNEDRLKEVINIFNGRDRRFGATDETTNQVAV